MSRSRDYEVSRHYPEQQYPQDRYDDLQISRRNMNAISRRREDDYTSMVCGAADMAKFTGLSKNAIDNHVAIVSYIDTLVSTCPSAEHDLRMLQQLHLKGIAVKMEKWSGD